MPCEFAFINGKGIKVDGWCKKEMRDESEKLRNIKLREKKLKVEKFADRQLKE